MAILGSLTDTISKLYTDYISPLSAEKKAAGGIVLTTGAGFLYDPQGAINFASSHFEPLTSRAIEFYNTNADNHLLMGSFAIGSAVCVFLLAQGVKHAYKTYRPSQPQNQSQNQTENQVNKDETQENDPITSGLLSSETNISSKENLLGLLEKVNGKLETGRKIDIEKLTTIHTSLVQEHENNYKTEEELINAIVNQVPPLPNPRPSNNEASNDKEKPENPHYPSDSTHSSSSEKHKFNTLKRGQLTKATSHFFKEVNSRLEDNNKVSEDQVTKALTSLMEKKEKGEYYFVDNQKLITDIIQEINSLSENPLVVQITYSSSDKPLATLTSPKTFSSQSTPKQPTPLDSPTKLSIEQKMEIVKNNITSFMTLINEQIDPKASKEEVLIAAEFLIKLNAVDLFKKSSTEQLRDTLIQAIKNQRAMLQLSSPSSETSNSQKQTPTPQASSSSSRINQTTPIKPASQLIKIEEIPVSPVVNRQFIEETHQTLKKLLPQQNFSIEETGEIIAQMNLKATEIADHLQGIIKVGLKVREEQEKKFHNEVFILLKEHLEANGFNLGSISLEEVKGALGKAHIDTIQVAEAQLNELALLIKIQKVESTIGATNISIKQSLGKLLNELLDELSNVEDIVRSIKLKGKTVDEITLDLFCTEYCQQQIHTHIQNRRHAIDTVKNSHTVSPSLTDPALIQKANEIATSFAALSTLLTSEFYNKHLDTITEPKLSGVLPLLIAEHNYLEGFEKANQIVNACPHLLFLFQYLKTVAATTALESQESLNEFTMIAALQKKPELMEKLAPIIKEIDKSLLVKVNKRYQVKQDQFKYKLQDINLNFEELICLDLQEFVETLKEDIKDNEELNELNELLNNRNISNEKRINTLHKKLKNQLIKENRDLLELLSKKNSQKEQKRKCKYYFCEFETVARKVIAQITNNKTFPEFKKMMDEQFLPELQNTLKLDKSKLKLDQKFFGKFEGPAIEITPPLSKASSSHSSQKSSQPKASSRPINTMRIQDAMQFLKKTETHDRSTPMLEIPQNNAVVSVFNGAFKNNWTQGTMKGEVFSGSDLENWGNTVAPKDLQKMTGTQRFLTNRIQGTMQKPPAHSHKPSAQDIFNKKN